MKTKRYYEEKYIKVSTGKKYYMRRVKDDSRPLVSYLPFHYRQTRDIRTLTHLAGHQRNESTIDPKDKTHNALEDCLYQVKYCVECFNKLKENQNER